MQYAFLQRYLNSARKESRKGDDKETDKKTDGKKNDDWLTK